MPTAETAALVAWLEDRGAFVHPSLELFGQRDSQERGVFALQPIEEGELLLRLPRTAVICVCEDTDETSWLPMEVRSMSAVVRTSLYLMRERALGENSDWAPYLDLLPKSYDTLENWAQAELEFLRGTSVHDHLSGLRDESGDLIGAARFVYDKQVGPVVRAHPQVWPDPSADAFLNACAAVRTRGFHDTGTDGGGPYLLPAIDMLNHARAGAATSLVVERMMPMAPPPRDLEEAAASSCDSPLDSAVGSTAVSPSTTGATAGSASEEPHGPSIEEASSSVVRGPTSEIVWSMRAERRLAAGEEIMHSYDALDNAQLLLCYGFVARPEESPLPTSARMPLTMLLAAASRTRDSTLRSAPWDVGEGWAEKEAACIALLEPYGGAVSVSKQDPLPDALITVLQFMLMPLDDFRELIEEEVRPTHEEDHCDAIEAKDSGSCQARRGQPTTSAGINSVDAASGSGGASSSDGVCRPRRIPMLDASVVESEPAFASLVVGALLHAVDMALRRYPDDGELAVNRRYTDSESATRPMLPLDYGSGENDGSTSTTATASSNDVTTPVDLVRERRRRMAAELVAAEKDALLETRRVGLQLMLAAEQYGEGQEGSDDAVAESSSSSSKKPRR